jgi:hypothetical protein
MHDGGSAAIPDSRNVNFEETILLCIDPASLRARVASYPAPLQQAHLMKEMTSLSFVVDKSYSTHTVHTFSLCDPVV